MWMWNRQMDWKESISKANMERELASPGTPEDHRRQRMSGQWEEAWRLQTRCERRLGSKSKAVVQQLRSRLLGIKVHSVRFQKESASDTDTQSGRAAMTWTAMFKRQSTKYTPLYIQKVPRFLRSSLLVSPAFLYWEVLIGKHELQTLLSHASAISNILGSHGFTQRLLRASL